LDDDRQALRGLDFSLTDEQLQERISKRQHAFG